MIVSETKQVRWGLTPCLEWGVLGKMVFFPNLILKLGFIQNNCSK
ncbi:unnamed protein product, partial [Vitis vinifera]